MNKFINGLKSFAFVKNSNTNNYPNIIYDSNDIESRLSRAYINGVSINKCLAVIFSKLGFTSLDGIVVDSYHYVYDEDDDRGFRLECRINSDKVINILFKYRDSFDEQPMIIFDEGNIRKGYNIRCSGDGIEDIRLDINYSEIVTSSLVLCNRNHSYYSVKYKIVNGDYTLEFEVGRPSGIEGNGEYKIDNEDDLSQYLTSLTFPVKIDEVYKKISEDFLGDVSKYPKVEILVTKNDSIRDKYVITDMITMYRGNWEKFIMTKDNKTVVLNADDEWSYEVFRPDSAIQFFMKSDNFDVSYTVSAINDEQIDKYTYELAKNDVAVARSEVENAHKLVRRLFDKK